MMVVCHTPQVPPGPPRSPQVPSGPWLLGASVSGVASAFSGVRPWGDESHFIHRVREPDGSVPPREVTTPLPSPEQTGASGTGCGGAEVHSDPIQGSFTPALSHCPQQKGNGDPSRDRSQKVLASRLLRSVSRVPGCGGAAASHRLLKQRPGEAQRRETQASALSLCASLQLPAALLTADRAQNQPAKPRLSP